MPSETSDRLRAYRSKRDFTRTREPEPDEGHIAANRFVVQKHDARRLHYDLRLELDGVLLSWAVPQGPSYSPTQKRLAVRTEDHPLKYLEFEGTIPKGEYGGGAMIVWDRGLWAPAHDPHKSLDKGHLEFTLAGERLRGRWHLVRMKTRVKTPKEQWLLIKAEDDYQRADADPDILAQETTSVLSGKTTEELEAATAVREDHRKRGAVAAARSVRLSDPRRLAGVKKALLRVFVEPCLASAAEKPPSGERWRHEVKFDGYRMQARVDADDIRLLTRTGLDWTNRFPTIADAVKSLKLGSAVLDGEIVVDDERGVSSFSELVSDLKSGRKDRMKYYLFDLLYLNGSDLRDAALADRKTMLSEILSSAPPDDRLRLSEHFEIEGPRFFDHVSRLGLEGMVSKLRDAPYRSGRSGSWLKTRCVQSQEFVVIGFVPSTASRRIVGSLVLGYYENTRLTLAGRVGSGFSQEEAGALFSALQEIRRDKTPLVETPPKEAAKGVQWVEPRFVVQVDFHTWAEDGLIRHAIYRGVREDKVVSEVVREGRSPPATAAKAISSTALTHPDRLLWPAEGVTKQGLADYYLENADRLLPHVVNRPLSLVRCPGGVAETCFYAKRAWAGLTGAVRQIETGKREQSLVVDDIEGILALVQANVLEIHPWGSTLDDLERPDRLIFDLDPGDGVAWAAVVEAARDARERLKTALKLESFVKTSGGKGLHVVVPLRPSLEWPEAKEFCKKFAEAMAADSPGRYLANMAKHQREGRIFVDYLRNGRGATAVAAYSTRARPGAGVSTPLAWEELSEAIKADHFRLTNIGRRLAHLPGDPWAGFFKTKQSLDAQSAERLGRRTRPSAASATRARRPA
jgi:bifunctional non-homologous end joining protein LigD